MLLKLPKGADVAAELMRRWSRDAMTLSEGEGFEEHSRSISPIKFQCLIQLEVLLAWCASASYR